MDFIWLVLFLIMFGTLSGLRDRVTRLEKRLSETAPTQVTTPAVTSSPSPAPLPHIPTVTPTVTAPSTAPQPSGPMPGDQFIAWLKEDWLMKLGSLLLLMGLGWFIAYAFSNNWIGPMGRILIGLGLGALIFLLGAVRIKRYVHQGEVFIVVGATTILLTLYAARSVYGFFTPATVLVTMFIISAAIAALSVIRDSRALAVSSLLMALAAPLFVASTEPNYVSLFGYLVAVMVGTIWIVALRKQRSLSLIPLAGTWAYSFDALLHLSRIPAESHTVLYVLISAIVLIFSVSTVANYAHNTEPTPDGDALDVVGAIAAGALLWLWGSQLLSHDMQWVTLFGWATFFVFGGIYSYLLTRRAEALYTFGGVGVFLLGVATSIRFEGHTLAIAWTLEAAVLTIGTLLMTRRVGTSSLVGVTFIAPIVYSLEFFNFSGLPHYDDGLVLALLAASLLATGGLLGLLARNEEEDSFLIPMILRTLGVLYLFTAATTVWEHAALTNVWTLIAFGTSTFVYGVTKQRMHSYAASLSFIFPVVRSVEHLQSSAWKAGVFHFDAFALLLLATSLLAIGVLWRRESDISERQPRGQEADPSFAIMSFASLYYGAILWLAAPTLVGKSYAVMFSLVVYTLIGLGFYLVGRARQNIERSVYGAAVLGFVVLRLLVIDVWQMELSGRIVTFLLIGALLVSTAFIGRSPRPHQ